MSDTRRPFYAEYAWAYDLIIDRPVQKECAAMVDWLNERGVFPGAALLDAGCGTGRYAHELARRGYVVHGIDASPEFIAQARAAGSSPSVSFEVGTIMALAPARYDAILCRGVLNDVIDRDDRDAVFAAFAGALRPDGVLILDVREWEATAERKQREPLFTKRVATDRGTLTFTSLTELDAADRRLIVTERHALTDGARETTADYRFVMGCWTREELRASLAGFDRVTVFGAYDPAVPAGATDRLVVIAQRSAA